MKKLIIFAVALGLAASIQAAPNPKPPPPPQDVTVINDAANPVPVTVQNPSGERQFVGFSNDSVLGDVGLVGMHGACFATYGAGARMCLDIEVLKTPGLQPDLTVPSGWIQPTPNETGRYGINCAGWTFSAPDGVNTGYVLSGERMTLGSDETTFPGGVRVRNQPYCSDARPVACCQ